MKRIFTSWVLAVAMAQPVVSANTFTPGQTWNDTKGSAINAHGGCIVYSDGYYYWFGENRNGGKSAGISCYRSSDLYNWERLGLAVTPTGTMTDECRDIASGRTLERPKVIYNDKTGKWVMWIHWENGSDYGQAKSCVCIADKVSGPYTLVDVYRPNNCDARDQTLFKDDDGKAYHVYSTNMNSNTNCEILADDYLTPLTDYNTQLKGRKYEAASIFKVGETYYGLFSGCTGWSPNPGRYMWTTDLMGTWTAPADFKASDGTTGINFCVDDGASTTYTSQSAYVIPVHGKEKCFIYYGDRWNSGNIQSSKYVWLPLSVRSGYPAVRWYDSWDLSFFDHMYDMKRAKELADGMECYILDRYSNRFVSRPQSVLTIEDDGSTNLMFRLHATDDPYAFRIEDTTTGKYMQAVYGTMRWMTDNADEMAQKWYFILQEDGCYKIKNVADGSCLSVSGNSTLAGSGIYLNEDSKTIHQTFGIYFDSVKHDDYEEADMWSRSYREENLRKMEIQTAIETIPSISPADDAVYNMSGQRVDRKSLRSGIYIIGGKKIIVK